MESNRNQLTVRKNISTLNILYLISAIIFLLLSALFSLKLWLRFDFDGFTSLIVNGERDANSRFYNMGKIIQITRKLDLENRGVIFDSSSDIKSIIQSDQQILKKQLSQLFTRDLKFQGEITTFKLENSISDVDARSV